MYRKSDLFTIFLLVLVFEQTCGTALGGDCTSVACVTLNAVCSAGTKLCECAPGYTKQSTACKADIGTACTATADCDTTTTPAAVCDVLATPKVCKIKSTGDCTGKTDKCVSGAACTSNLCVCSTKYKENAAKLCATVLGSICTATAECTPTVANADCTGPSGSMTCTCNAGFTAQGADCSGNLGTACTTTADCDTTTNPAAVCPTTGTKICTCAAGYKKQGTACKADLGTACNATVDCDTTTTPTAVCDVLATTKVCKIRSTGDCTGNTDKCVSGAACTTNACACSAKYKENTDKLCATVLGSTCTATADCTTTVANSDCTGTGTKTCTCNAGFTKQGAECSGATGVAACLAMILACIFTTIV